MTIGKKDLVLLVLMNVTLDTKEEMLKTELTDFAGEYLTGNITTIFKAFATDGAELRKLVDDQGLNKDYDKAYKAIKRDGRIQVNKTYYLLAVLEYIREYHTRESTQPTHSSITIAGIDDELNVCKNSFKESLLIEDLTSYEKATLALYKGIVKTYKALGLELNPETTIALAEMEK